MSNKEVQRNRMMLYFINATNEIIDEFGIEEVTLRKVADRAGYNSATLYNYFENLDHLIFYAVMKNTKEYSLALNTYLLETENAMDRFLRVWECFCDYSYDKPEIFNAIFFPNLNKDLEHYVQEYYLLFPDDLVKSDVRITTMLLKRNIEERGLTTIQDCINEGYIRSEDAARLNDMTLIIYEGMLKRVLRKKVTYDDARNSTMDYIKFIVEGFLIKEYKFYY